MSATTVGFRITVRGRRIYQVDVEPTSDDPGHQRGQRHQHPGRREPRIHRAPPWIGGTLSGASRSGNRATRSNPPSGLVTPERSRWLATAVVNQG